MNRQQVNPRRRTGVLGVVGILWVVAFLGAGCWEAFKPKPTTVAAQIAATAAVNADARKRPSPIVVRVYELAGRNAFDTVDFVSLYERDKEVLATDLVSREEMALRPGESREWKKTLAPGTRFIGVVAAYREIEKAQWRAVHAVKPLAANKLVISADELAVSIK